MKDCLPAACTACRQGFGRAEFFEHRQRHYDQCAAATLVFHLPANEIDILTIMLSLPSFGAVWVDAKDDFTGRNQGGAALDVRPADAGEGNLLADPGRGECARRDALDLDERFLDFGTYRSGVAKRSTPRSELHNASMDQEA